MDEDFFEELEEILIQADVGFDTVMELIDELKMEVNEKIFKIQKKFRDVISEKLVDIYESGEDSIHRIEYSRK